MHFSKDLSVVIFLSLAALQYLSIVKGFGVQPSSSSWRRCSKELLSTSTATKATRLGMASEPDDLLIKPLAQPGGRPRKISANSAATVTGLPRDVETEQTMPPPAAAAASPSPSPTSATASSLPSKAVFDESLMEDMHNALDVLQRRVEEGPGSLSLSEVEDFEGMSRRILHEMKHPQQNKTP